MTRQKATERGYTMKDTEIAERIMRLTPADRDLMLTLIEAWSQGNDEVADAIVKTLEERMAASKEIADNE